MSGALVRLRLPRGQAGVEIGTLRGVLELPSPPLRDGSVRLRPWSAADVPAVVAACQDPAISRFSPVIPFPYARDDAVQWLEGQAHARRGDQALELAVVAGDSGELLGAIALSSVNLTQGKAFIGYWLAPQARGHGYMSAAVRLLARWAFAELGFGRLELTIHPQNTASQAVAERCGGAREGLLRSNVRIRHSGERCDSLIYGLVPSDLR